MNNISNKEKAVAFLKAIETGASEPIAEWLDGLGDALAATAGLQDGIAARGNYYARHGNTR